MRTRFHGVSSLIVWCFMGTALHGQDPRTAVPGVGVLVMAHGGSAEWDAAVRGAVTPLAERVPVEIAFGMADPATLQQGVAALEERGVSRIAVVRLFLSRHSFQHQTEYLLGLRPDPPARFVEHAGGHHGTDPQPVARRAEVRLSRRGLVESPVVGAIVRDRVSALSVEPASENVLVLAHGMGSDDENADLVRALDAALDSVRALGPFRAVRGETLREDWPDLRRAAERELREFVRWSDGSVLVVPLRLSGFGPYAEVLAGLDYRASGVGLLPHALISQWIASTAAEVFCDAGWVNPLRECRASGD